MPYAKHVYHLFVIQVKNNSGERRKLSEYLNNAGISTGMHYPVPLHLQKCFAHLNYQVGDFPVTEKLADHCLSLPMYPEMTKQQVDYVCLKIKDFYSDKVYAQESQTDKISEYIFNTPKK